MSQIEPEKVVRTVALGAAALALVAVAFSWIGLRAAAAASLLCLLGAYFPGRTLRILRSIPARLILGFVVLGSLMALGYEGRLHPLVVVFFIFAAYAVLVVLLEGRFPQEILTVRAAPELLYGIGLGFFFCLSALQLRRDSFAAIDFSGAGVYLAGAILAGVCEELFFRGVMLRITQEVLGSLLSLFLSALIFGLFHTTGHRLETFLAGLALGACYLATQRLWLPIGGHLTQNFIMDLVSGGDSRNLAAMMHQSPLLSGLRFGLLLTLTAILLGYSYKKGRLRSPRWSRRREGTQATLS
jgi:membrane protease YdiL (CAAX protease family)